MSFKRLQYPFEWYHKTQLGRDGNLAGFASSDIDKLMRTGRMKKFVEGHSDAILNLFSCCVYFNYDTRDNYIADMRRLQDDDWCEYQLEMTDKCVKCFENHYAICSHCDDILCIQCAKINGCIDCKDIIYCLSCENDGNSDITYCHSDECRLCEWICKECRLDRCRYSGNNCESCRSMSLDTLLEEVDEQGAELERSKSIMFTTSKRPPITIRIKEPDYGVETLVTMERSTKMETLFQAFAEKDGWDVRSIRFTLRGETIRNDATPESLDLQDMAEIEADGIEIDAC